MTMEIGMGGPKIELRLFLPLRLFERQLIEKIEYKGIDITNPKNKYHSEMVEALVMRHEGEENSLIGQIVEESGLTNTPLQKIVVESFEADDVSLDIGTKRNVDRFILQFEDGKELVMTVSLDKNRYKKGTQSPSFQETEALNNVKDSSLVWSVQRWFGSTIVEDEGGIRGLICKEFIPGQMLANITVDLDLSIETYGINTVRSVAYEVGRMLANALAGLGGVPLDSTALNIIISEDQSGETRARYCDVEAIRKDPAGIQKEIKMAAREFGKLGVEVIKGFKENYRGDIRVEL